MDKLAFALLVTFLAATLYPFGSCAPTPGNEKIPDDSQGDSSPASESKSGGDKADSNPLDVGDEERGHPDKPPDDSQGDPPPVSQDSSITGNLDEPAESKSGGGDKTDQNPLDVGDEGIGHPDKPSNTDDELDVSSHVKGDTGMDEGDEDSQPREQEKKGPENPPDASQRKNEEVLDGGDPDPDADQSENEHDTDSESHPDGSDGLDSAEESENPIPGPDSKDPGAPHDVGDAVREDLSDENEDETASEVNPETHEDDVGNDELDVNPSTKNPDLGKKQDAGDNDNGETKNPGHEMKEETSEADPSDQHTDGNPKNPNNELKNPKGEDSKEDQEEVEDESHIDQDVNEHSQNLEDKLNNPEDVGKGKSEFLENGNTAVPNQHADENPQTSDQNEPKENLDDLPSPQDGDAGGEESPMDPSVAPKAGNENENTETPVVPKSTLEPEAVPSISPTLDKSLSENENLSTGKSAITTRSTTENKPEIPADMTSQASNFPTFYNNRPTFPNMNRPPWSSMPPAGFRPTTYSQYPYFYYNGQSSYPVPTSPFNADYATNPSKPPQETTAEQIIEPSASTAQSEMETTPENVTESTPQVTNPSSTPEPEIIQETTTGVLESTPKPTSTVVTSTEEATTAQETVSETTQHSQVILPEDKQTEASPVLEPTTKAIETPPEATEENDNVHHNRKRPPVNPGEGREGGSSVPKKDEEEENKSTSTTTSTTTTTTTEVSDESTSTGDLVSEETDWVKQTQSYVKKLVKQMGALKVSLILLAILALSILAICCCCRICKKKGYRMRQRRLKEFGQEKEFLLRDRNKGSKYNNDTVTLLEGSSEDEF